MVHGVRRARGVGYGHVWLRRGVYRLWRWSSPRLAGQRRTSALAVSGDLGSHMHQDQHEYASKYLRNQGTCSQFRGFDHAVLDSGHQLVQIGIAVEIEDPWGLPPLL